MNVFRQKTDPQSTPVRLSLLRPDGTSLRHVGCQQDPPGKLQRTGKEWDWATCDAGHIDEQTHRNAAKRLVERFENQT
ncbi:MAG: hypothetical protein ACFFBD_19400 [Candidatus Hodarchaeota archaeon]